jgi:hypothetical protein
MFTCVHHLGILSLRVWFVTFVAPFMALSKLLGFGFSVLPLWSQLLFFPPALMIHQGGGEPLRPMPLEITRCLHVLGAELVPPPPPVRRGPGRVVVVDTPWPNGQLATVVAGAVSCRLLVASGTAGGASAGATLGRSLRPGLGAST